MLYWRSYLSAAGVRQTHAVENRQRAKTLFAANSQSRQGTHAAIARRAYGGGLTKNVGKRKAAVVANLLCASTTDTDVAS